MPGCERAGRYEVSLPGGPTTHSTHLPMDTRGKGWRAWMSGTLPTQVALPGGPTCPGRGWHGLVFLDIRRYRGDDALPGGPTCPGRGGSAPRRRRRGRWQLGSTAPGGAPGREGRCIMGGRWGGEGRGGGCERVWSDVLRSVLRNAIRRLRTHFEVDAPLTHTLTHTYTHARTHSLPSPSLSFSPHPHSLPSPSLTRQSAKAICRKRLTWYRVQRGG